MKPSWCVLRVSLFPTDFEWQKAGAEERSLFEAAVQLVRSRFHDETDPNTVQTGGSLELFEARVRSRSSPRGLFAAAALGVNEGKALSLKDVRVEITPSRELERLSGRPNPATGTLVVSPWVVFYGEGACQHSYNTTDRDYESFRLKIPQKLRNLLLEKRQASREEWEHSFSEAGYSVSDTSNLIDELIDLGILVYPSRPVIFNGDEVPTSMDIQSATTFAHNLTPSNDISHPVNEKRPSPWSAYSTFCQPVVMPESLCHVREVTQFLCSLAKPENTGVAAVLGEYLDGRWLPLPELEDMCGGLMAEAGRRRENAPDTGDVALMDWIRERGFQREIDLEAAPSTHRSWKGDVLLLTEWGNDGHLLEPVLFGMGAREVLSRYSLPGLAKALDEQDSVPTILVAYHGASTLGDVAEVYAPHSTVLNYCGEGSEFSHCLRLEDLEVTSTGDRLRYRRRDTLQQVRLVCPVPLNEESPKLHPFIRMLLSESRCDSISLPLFKIALQDFPVRPRLTWRGHVIRRRRAAVPAHLDEQNLGVWLHQHGFEGDIGLEGSAGRLRLDPHTDNAGRRLLFRTLRAGKPVVISEVLEPAGVPVDGRVHSAHALIPVRCGVGPATTSTLGAKITPPPSRRELRGPFISFRIRVLAVRIPDVLSRLRDTCLGEHFFYVIMGGNITSELRVRIDERDHICHQNVIQSLNSLMDNCVIIGWTYEPYLREWDRYGGSSDIDQIEAWFVADSLALIGACSTLGREDLRRTDLYTLCIIQTLEMAGFDRSESQQICREGVTRLGQEFSLSSSDRRALGVEWRQRRTAILASYRGEGDELIQEVMSERWRLLSPWPGKPGNQDRLRRHYRSLIHMTGVRIHLQRNRWEELKALFYACHALQCLIHQPAQSE